MVDKCDSCRREFGNPMMFLRISEGSTFPHLWYKKVCVLCQVTGKKCSQCGSIFPTIPGTWFHKKENGLYGTYSRCVMCVAANIKSERQQSLEHS